MHSHEFNTIMADRIKFGQYGEWVGSRALQTGELIYPYAKAK